MNNPWELFFYQPYNFSLEEVKKNAKNIVYFNCTGEFFRPDEINIYDKKDSILFWKNIGKKYMPFKREILYEVEIIMKNLFGNSKNILGVKLRGTDYKNKIKGYSVQPNIEQVVSDVKSFDEKYKYDFIYFTTEDESIKKNFLEKFDEKSNKIKLLPPDDKYMIKFKEYEFLTYIKNYVFSVLILSKCLDIITCRCTGATGVILLTKGFRHSIFYNLGTY